MESRNVETNKHGMLCEYSVEDKKRSNNRFEIPDDYCGGFFIYNTFETQAAIVAPGDFITDFYKYSKMLENCSISIVPFHEQPHKDEFHYKLVDMVLTQQPVKVYADIYSNAPKEIIAPQSLHCAQIAAEKAAKKWDKDAANDAIAFDIIISSTVGIAIGIMVLASLVCVIAQRLKSTKNNEEKSLLPNEKRVGLNFSAGLNKLGTLFGMKDPAVKKAKVNAERLTYGAIQQL